MPRLADCCSGRTGNEFLNSALAELVCALAATEKANDPKSIALMNRRELSRQVCLDFIPASVDWNPIGFKTTTAASGESLCAFLITSLRSRRTAL